MFVHKNFEKSGLIYEIIASSYFINNKVYEITEIGFEIKL